MGLYAAVLPFALGAMISPTVLTLEVLILSGKRDPKLRAWLFTIGAGAFLLAYGLVLGFFLGKASDANAGAIHPDWVKFTVELAAALALLALGVRTLTKPKKTRPSKLAVKVQHAKGWEFLIVGVLTMAANFSTLVLYWPGVHLITQSNAAFATELGASVMLFLITMVPALGPILLVTLLGKKSDGILLALNHFVTRFNKQINAGICFFFTALLVWGAVKSVIG